MGFPERIQPLPPHEDFSHVSTENLSSDAARTIEQMRRLGKDVKTGEGPALDVPETRRNEVRTQLAELARRAPSDSEAANAVTELTAAIRNLPSFWKLWSQETLKGLVQEN